MSIPYLVRKKVSVIGGHRKTLWYAVQKKLQGRGGMTEVDVARLVAEQTGFREGEVQGILTEVASVMGKLLEGGYSVNLKGIGSFQVALTSPGAEQPEDVTPGTVSVSRVYFIADRWLTKRIKQMKFIRIPLSGYFPKSMLSKELIKREAKIGDLPWEADGTSLDDSCLDTVTE